MSLTPCRLAVLEQRGKVREGARSGTG